MKATSLRIFSNSAGPSNTSKNPNGFFDVFEGPAESTKKTKTLKYIESQHTFFVCFVSTLLDLAGGEFYSSEFDPTRDTLHRIR